VKRIIPADSVAPTQKPDGAKAWAANTAICRMASFKASVSQIGDLKRMRPDLSTTTYPGNRERSKWNPVGGERRVGTESFFNPGIDQIGVGMVPHHHLKSYSISFATDNMTVVLELHGD
jgi:hypothetical protein